MNTAEKDNVGWRAEKRARALVIRRSLPTSRAGHMASGCEDEGADGHQRSKSGNRNPSSNTYRR